jgi:hypothetical protein
MTKSFLGISLPVAETLTTLTADAIRVIASAVRVVNVSATGSEMPRKDLVMPISAMKGAISG